jgi:hypothetical protein
MSTEKYAPNPDLEMVIAGGRCNLAFYDKITTQRLPRTLEVLAMSGTEMALGF